MVKTHICNIAFWPSYYRAIAISPSFHRVFIIVPSCFHHRTIVHRGYRLNKKSRLSKRNIVVWTLVTFFLSLKSYTRWYKGEIEMVRWLKHDGTIVKSRWWWWWYDSIEKIISRFYHRTIAFSLTYHRDIALSPLYHRERNLVWFSVSHQVQPIKFLELEILELIVPL
jgi:hypothetical protein